MGTREDWIASTLRTTAITLCGVYGVVMLLIAISFGMDGIGKGVVDDTALVFLLPAGALLCAALGAVLCHRLWVLAALAGSVMVLVIPFRENNASTFDITQIAPMTVIGLLTPVAIILISLATLKYRSKEV